MCLVRYVHINIVAISNYFLFIGTITIKSVELRKQSGWYGVQPEGRKRLIRNTARDTIVQKAGYAKGAIDINRPGIYIMVHKPTNQAYVGQAKNLGNRILQHICDATSTRSLVGSFDTLLRENINMDDWELQLQPCAQKDLNRLENKYYDDMQDDSYFVINKQNPPNT